VGPVLPIVAALAGPLVWYRNTITHILNRPTPTRHNPSHPQQDAGDLLVNFFASVHRNYSVNSLQDMATTEEAEENNTDARAPAPVTATGTTAPPAASPLTPLAAGGANAFLPPKPEVAAAGGLSSVASSPSEATFAPEPSPVSTAAVSPKCESEGEGEGGVGWANGNGSGGGTCKEEEEGAAPMASNKRQKVVVDGC
jgi:hypothetical protein